MVTVAAKLREERMSNNFHGYNDHYRRIRGQLLAARRRWIEVSRKRSGDPLRFVQIRLKTLLSLYGVEDFGPVPRVLTEINFSPTPVSAEASVAHRCTSTCDSDCEEGVTLPLVRYPMRRGALRRNNRRPIPLCVCPVGLPTIRNLCRNCSGRIPSTNRRTIGRLT
jgi:hypothetical protein